MKEALENLRKQLTGELRFDDLHKAMYATDASVYRKLPLAVAFPKDDEDIKYLCAFAKAYKTSLIPRTAGTSLAGQAVGNGIIVDVSKHFTEILNFDKELKQVTVQPGVIRDELNRFLEPHGVFFGPNTSTANRCMMGGMVGNNSSGTTSIKYGVTRDKVVRLKTILSDGSKATFEKLNALEFKAKKEKQTLEGEIYRTIDTLLKTSEAQAEIRKQFPKPEIHRRNNGYAIDKLIEQSPYTTKGDDLNVCTILAGSEGTLAFTTEITLQLDDLPPAYGIVVASHHDSIKQCMNAVVPAMQHDLYTCEMMDKVILDCTKNNREQEKNRFFVSGDPAAILMLEVRANSLSECRLKADALIDTLEKHKVSYAHPILEGTQIDQAMELRKAGLGLLGNLIGDRKAVACIEDTAVALDDLAPYIAEFTALMKRYDQDAVYYAHAGAGEIHLRPILNIKQAQDVKFFRAITTDVAKLVKKYKGAMSGEHGDGIVRSEFIPMMIGEHNYEIIKEIKKTFDPYRIFNEHKIVDAFPMDESLRYEIDRKEPEIKTLLDFSDQEGILKTAEKCNGSGDCRKLPAAGGTMCPSYRATRDEKDTTRARANVLREFLTNSDQENRFNHSELKEVFDLCLSCKACATECPSTVDVATLKAEFQYQYQKVNGSSLRTKLFAHNTQINKIGAKAPKAYNILLKTTGGLAKRVLGIARKRSLPELKVFRKTDAFAKASTKANPPIKKVALYIDEFSAYLDGDVASDALFLLRNLGYEVEIVEGIDSGRSHISKGFLEEAQKLAQENSITLAAVLDRNDCIVGIEPSAVLTFKDEYVRLINNTALTDRIKTKTFLIEEFIANEFEIGNISATQFNTETRKLKIHAHCHQKALSSTAPTFVMLNIPVNYKPTIIPSGCCGMAGSFGYEKEHYDISMQIGEQTLFPAVRKASEDVVIVANGTSCRHQIKDGTAREALHPVTVLRRALVL